MEHGLHADILIVEKFATYLLTQRCVAHNTFIAYINDLKQLCDFLHQRSQSLLTAQYYDISDFLTVCAHNHMSARARSRKLSSIKSFFKWAQQIHSYTDTAKSIPFPRLEKKLPRYLNTYQIELLFKEAAKDTSARGLRNRIIIFMLYATGMRITELIQLKISHIDYKERFIKIYGKGGKERMVPFPEQLIIPLQEYVTTITYKTEYLFPIAYGKKIKPLSRQLAWMVLKKLCAQAGIKQVVSPHILRHSLATHLLQQGANLRALQLLLGHQSINTVEVYTHVETEAMRKVYNKKHPRA